MSRRMSKGEFITKVKAALGEEVDPLGLKKNLETGENGIGRMSYTEAARFILNNESLALLDEARETVKSDTSTGIVNPHTPTVEGLRVASRSRALRRSGFGRAVENIIIKQEKEGL